MGNAKAIDLFAEKGTRTVNVQVKAISRRQHVGWPIFRRQVLRNVMYVFVCLNEDSEPPDYYIATAREVRPKIKEYRTRGILNRSAVRDERFHNRWDKLHEALK